MNDKIEGIIQYDDYQKNCIFPDNYDMLLKEILLLFNISEDKKHFLIITYKNTSGDSIKITNQEEYLEIVKGDILRSSEELEMLTRKICKDKNNVADVNVVKTAKCNNTYFSNW